MVCIFIQDVYNKLEFERKYGSQHKVNNQVSNLNQSQIIATYAPSCIGYCYNSKPNACTNKAFSSTNHTIHKLFFGKQESQESIQESQNQAKIPKIPESR